MECPACKTDVDNNRHRCQRCNYGIRPVAAPTGPHPPRYLGDKGEEEFDTKLARTYRCSNCRSFGARVNRIRSSGAVAFHPTSWPYHEYIVASCHFCGLVQHFDPQVLDQNPKGWKSVDFLFEN